MEAGVIRLLDRLDVQHEWFQVRRRVIHSGKLVLRTLPLFPGYIFIIAKFMWEQIERLTGCRGFLRFGGTVEDVPDRIVNGLKLRAGPSGVLTEDSLPFREGDRVWVKFGGEVHLGTFRSYLNPARVVCDVPMMGRAVCVTSRIGELRLAS
jgi:transcription antitermination factor NusG